MNTSPSFQTIYSWVQKMNNSAALCLEIGQHERAIKSLAKALQISRSYIKGSANNDEANNVTSGVCKCQFLSLDQCIHYSEDYIRNCSIHRKLRTIDSRGSISDNRSEETIRRRFLQRRQDRRNRMGSEKNVKNQVFLYQELIQVPDLSNHPNSNHYIHSKQIMVLSLISVFNLAVVCHLRAMDQIGKMGLNHQANTDLLKALKLYEVAYNALAKQNDVSDESTRSSSIQFKLILCNNLSHVHRLTGNQSEYERYLREVLSVTMSLVDSNNRPWNNSSENNISSSEDAQNNFQRRQPKCIDLEGFLANAAPLLTENVCADAA